MTRDLVAAVNENHREAFRSLAASIPGGDVQAFGSITVASAGFPAPIYNQAFIFEPPAERAVREAVDWLSDRDIPFWITPTDDALEPVAAVASDLDIARIGEMPGMVRDSLTGIPDPETPATITEVSDRTALDEFITVATSVFGTPKGVAEQGYQSALEAADNRLFLGRIQGDAVACGMLMTTEDVAGIYTMAVLASARRRGIGEAVACQLLRVGREDGCELAALQSSDMAKPLYEKLGFQTVTTYHHFGPVE